MIIGRSFLVIDTGSVMFALPVVGKARSAFLVGDFQDLINNNEDICKAPNAKASKRIKRTMKYATGEIMKPYKNI